MKPRDHFLVSFLPYGDLPVEFFITGRGRVGQQLDTNLFELTVKGSKLLKGELEDDLPRLSEGDGVRDAWPKSRSASAPIWRRDVS